MKFRLIASIVGMTAALQFAAPANALLMNGSFELGPPLNSTTNSAQFFHRGAPPPNDWSAVPGVDLPDIIGAGYTQTGAGFQVLLGPQHGVRFLDMNAAGQTGGIFQVVTGLTPGQAVQLSYWVGQWAQNSAGDLIASLIDPFSNTILNSDTTTFVKNQALTINDVSWTEHFLTAFVPLSGSLRVEFRGDSRAGATAAPGLDNVSLQVNAVPLSPAHPLFAIGLGAIGLLVWRKKRKAIAATAA
jgi:hypothetical protein